MESFNFADQQYECGNLDQAFDLFLALAKSGDIDAMGRVALMFADGEGVKRDYKKSIYWDTKAAKGGSSISMLNLGITWRTLGDLVKAKDWFVKALNAGNGEAALHLGKMYMFSHKEVDTARSYLQIAESHVSICPDSAQEASKLLKSNFFQKIPVSKGRST